MLSELKVTETDEQRFPKSGPTLETGVSDFEYFIDGDV